MTGLTTWQPLLDGALEAHARRILDEITVALREEPDDDDPSLGSGYLGPAIYFGYLDRFQPGAGHAGHGEALRDRAIDELARSSLPPGLYPGSTGIAWAVEHLQGDVDLSSDDANVEIDEALIAFVDGARPGADFDLLRGFTGIGVYALERARRPSGRLLLARVVERLRELAEPRGPGVAWRTPPENMWSVERERYPRGYYNLGVAHGAPAATLVLAAACALEVGDAHDLLEGAMRWLLARRRDADSPFVFPAIEDCGGGPALPSRAAWCYGDPGVAVALLATARAAANAEWEAAALAAATRAAARPQDGCGVKDAGVCHGAAGLALLFHRLWHATDDSRFADAARRWYAHTLHLHRPGEGTGGYCAWAAPDGDPMNAEWLPNRSLLSGAAGIGLVLLAGLGIEPRWDRMLAASLPPWATAT